MADLLRKILTIAGLVLCLIWLLSVAAGGFTAPAWVAAAGASCVAAAVAMREFIA